MPRIELWENEDDFTEPIGPEVTTSGASTNNQLAPTELPGDELDEE